MIFRWAIGSSELGLTSTHSRSARHPFTSSHRNDRLTLSSRKVKVAEPLLLKGYEGMKTREKNIPHVEWGEFRIPEALDMLIQLYEATNKPEEVKKYQDLRAKYPPAVAPKAKEKSK